MICVMMPLSSSKNLSDSALQLSKSFSTVSRCAGVGNGSFGSIAPSMPLVSTPSTIGRNPFSANCRWPSSLSTKSSHSCAFGSASASTAPGFSMRIVVSGMTQSSSSPFWVARIASFS